MTNIQEKTYAGYLTGTKMKNPQCTANRIKYNTCPVFVTYHKNDDIAGSTKISGFLH